ncbi:MAG: helix-turn-helix transcriptional regulator [Lachnospiraceae bacterium]|nr:helix-turn-helix transcriptional regulator [Lachnospiraceae bacterium]MBQ8878684.1 helix-turn-helix transcriptional regulator [Lachnospiraceae bacterium]
MISYEPLWETMRQKNISQYKLMQMGIDNRMLDALRHNKNITMLSLEKICDVLECSASDVVKFEKDK